MENGKRSKQLKNPIDVKQNIPLQDPSQSASLKADFKHQLNKESADLSSDKKSYGIGQEIKSQKRDLEAERAKEEIKKDAREIKEGAK